LLVQLRKLEAGFAGLFFQAELLKIEARLNALRSPFRSAEKFWVEEIIDPRKTRSLLCDFVRLAEPVRTAGKVSLSMRP
jgi:acetyl-CoA carboxylase carboxyltransferase component